MLRLVYDLHVTAETAHVINWLMTRGHYWGIAVPPQTSAEGMHLLHDTGFQIIGQIHGHPETRAWHWNRRGMATPDMDAFIEALRAVSSEGPRVKFFIEDDSAGIGFSAQYLRAPPRTHAEAKGMFDAYLDRAMQAANRFSDVEPWAMAGFAGTAHHYARHGVQCIIVERANDDVADLQTAIAFARGAARQFNRSWGIDLSLWWGVIYGCVQDLPASLYTRHLWLSYMSGAQVLHIEGGNLLVRPEGPTKVAKAIDAFASIAKSLAPGTVDTPVALMLPQDHGWMPPAYWRTTNEAWNYARLPYRQGQRGVDGFFGTAYPGSVYAQDPFPKGRYKDNEPSASPFALSCITEEFAPTPAQVYCAEPPLPFGAYANRNEARKDFFENKHDPSPFRPMGDSRWGDIFDVLTDDVDFDTLNAYPVVVLLEQITLTPALHDRLMRYVRDGGHLVLSAGVAGPENEALCGMTIQPELRVGRAWRWEEETPVHEAFRYCPVTVNNDELNILATTLDGIPLVTRYTLGAGVVYTCLLPWFEAGHTALAHLALRLFDHIIHPLQPVRVEGPPASWLSTQSDGAPPHRTVVIANHNPHVWQGTLSVSTIPKTLSHCIDIITGKSVEFIQENDTCIVRLDIAPYDVRVIRWAEGVPKQ